MLSDGLSQKLNRYWGFLPLIVWGGALLLFGLLRFDPYGIDESAARALLLNWSVADRMVTPIVTMGLPDLRVLFFAPLGAYWAGSLVALKVYMALITFGAAFFLYRWSREEQGEESALIASGLLLIAPLTLMQINMVGAGPFLLLVFGIAGWVNRAYRKHQKQLGGWYFVQLLLIFCVVSLHPAGLAYPLALALEWYKNPIDKRQQNQAWIGIAIATLLILILRFGWPTLEWGLNPLNTLGAMLFGHIPGDPEPMLWTAGIIPGGLLLLVTLLNWDRLVSSLLGRMLVLGLILGLPAADFSWALIGLTLLLYCGAPTLIRLNNTLKLNHFLGQRGVVMVVLFITATTFMLGDRAYRSAILNNSLEPHDQIIRTLALELEDVDESVPLISQWPGRTMLVTKQAVFPMPPAAETPADFFAMFHRSSYMVFDPLDPANGKTRENIAHLSSKIKTLVQEPAGVIVKINKDED